jgi:hypothetical protein
MSPLRSAGYLMAFAAISLVACGTTPPPIGRDLMNGSSGVRVQQFSERVRARFPVGSSEKELRVELRREHFPIGAATAREAPFQFVARVESSGLVVCRISWAILWSAQDDRITAINGRYSEVCL